jgi:hypothetical protein
MGKLFLHPHHASKGAKTFEEDVPGGVGIGNKKQGGLLRGAPLEEMSCLSWNCCGLGNAATVKELRDFVKRFVPTVLCVLET